jgi:hypothetical protein
VSLVLDLAGPYNSLEAKSPQWRRETDADPNYMPMKRWQNQANMSSQFGAEGHNFSVENQPWFLTCTERTCQRRMHTRKHGFWKYRRHQVDLESRVLHNLELALSHWQLVRFLPSTPAPFPPRLLLSIWLRCLGLDSACCSWLRLLSLSLCLRVSSSLYLRQHHYLYLYLSPFPLRRYSLDLNPTTTSSHDSRALLHIPYLSLRQ